ncbi:hypothetical protein MAPG_06942 [Magnaporthiopsis poae ATCC 64411]|uniref:Metallo-beta-lactamase domain-containing protein n=1 Tax=Magnaporthiopsis poae (strain ATCC 64411 / 73-15) TaxID=644358 RepID=A0A0C4E3E3_MAGP6|nr:hypothetical protein MAPG_06942 [Magnaporthiopsis poae ATCC 64411]
MLLVEMESMQTCKTGSLLSGYVYSVLFFIFDPRCSHILSAQHLANKIAMATTTAGAQKSSGMASTTVIRDVAPGLTLFSVPFTRGSIKLGGAMTVIKLSTSGALAVVSPIALTDDVRAKLASLGGEVRYVVSPNLEHHIHLGAWARAFPSAHVIVAEGLPEKRETRPETQGSTIVYGTVLTAANKSTTQIGTDFDADLDYEYVDGSKDRELVLLHRRSGTLIEGDLVFNLPAREAFSASGVDPAAGLAGRLVGSVLQTAKPGWQRRVAWHAAASDRARFAESVKRIYGWEFDRIIPCHGDVIESGGKKAFSDVLEPYLKL